MILNLVWSVLLSLSPFGESKVGIPFGMLSGLNIYIVFICCLVANILVFPLLMFFLEKVNLYLTRWHFYKKTALFVARRAKTLAGDKIEKYGFWGLVFFVMLPVPGTGVYVGCIAAYLFRMEKKKAFIANSIGISLSAIIVWSTTLLSMKSF